jgi:hypothetical protein
MKFAYVDESGTGDEPYAVMSAVVIDAQRMRPTKEDWSALLAQLSEIAEREIPEFHTRDFYAGNSPWRGIGGHERAEIISTIFKWFENRRHQVIFSAVDKHRLNNSFQNHRFAKNLGGLWQILGLHLALSIQRAYQSQKGNKGNTVLIFDAHDKDEREFSELILNPPEWTDTFYSRAKGQNRLDQIIDVPHFVDSKHVGMIQLADCVSFFLRRHLELTDGGHRPRYDGESEIVARWADIIFERCSSCSAMYPKRRRCEAADFFYQLAPERIK